MSRGKPEQLEADEPDRVAEAAARLGLKHVVITSVTRDDLPDGGAEHFYKCILAVRQRTGAAIEVLTPDFVMHKSALARVVEAAPEVFNHNMETVPRLYRRVRGPKSDYRWTLDLLAQIKQMNPAIKTKSGLMLGLGETRDELLDCLADLRSVGCDFLTLGQYLQPGPRYLPVVRYVPPSEFDELGAIAKQLGFSKVASGPFVRRVIIATWPKTASRLASAKDRHRNRSVSFDVARCATARRYPNPKRQRGIVLLTIRTEDLRSGP